MGYLQHIKRANISPSERWFLKYDNDGSVWTLRSSHDCTSSIVYENDASGATNRLCINQIIDSHNTLNTSHTTLDSNFKKLGKAVQATAAMNTAMSLDALKTSHPIDVKVNQRF